MSHKLFLQLRSKIFIEFVTLNSEVILLKCQFKSLHVFQDMLERHRVGAPDLERLQCHQFDFIFDRGIELVELNLLPCRVVKDHLEGSIENREKHLAEEDNGSHEENLVVSLGSYFAVADD